MANFEMESKLAKEYADELEELVSSLFDKPESLSIQGQLNQKLQIFEKHLTEMQHDFPTQSEKLGYWKGLIHDIHGRKQLAAHGLVDGVVHGAARSGTSSNDTGEMVAGLLFAALAGNRNKQKAADAIPFFSKAIEVYPAYGFYWHRAVSYEMSGQYQEALRDIEVLTEDGSPFYIDARKMKDEITQKLNNTNTEKKEKDRCFIATSAYKSFEAEEVLILRQFRDSQLLPKHSGRKFVEVYYRFSPPVARLLDRSNFLRSLVRFAFLNPLVALIRQYSKEA